MSGGRFWTWQMVTQAVENGTSESSEPQPNPTTSPDGSPAAARESSVPDPSKEDVGVDDLDLSDIPEPTAEDMARSKDDLLEALADKAGQETDAEQEPAAEEQAAPEEKTVEAEAKPEDKPAEQAAPAALPEPPDFESLDAIEIEKLPGPLRPWVTKVIAAAMPDVQAARASKEAWDRGVKQLTELAHAVDSATPTEKVRLLTAYHDELHAYATAQASEVGTLAEAYFVARHPEFAQAPKEIQERMAAEVGRRMHDRMEGKHLGEKLEKTWEFVKFSTGWTPKATAPAAAPATVQTAAPAARPAGPTAAAKAAAAPKAQVSVSLPAKTVHEMSLDEIMDEGDGMLTEILNQRPKS